MFLPSGLEELFEMAKFEHTDQAYEIWFDEKKQRSEEDRRNVNVVARGYTDYITIQDYPLRGAPSICICARTSGGTRRPMKSSAITRAPQRGRDTTQPGVRGFFKNEGGDDSTVN